MKLADQLLNGLKQQRHYFIRRADNEKMITDMKMYNWWEHELYRIQIAIGRENKKKIEAQ